MIEDITTENPHADTLSRIWRLEIDINGESLLSDFISLSGPISYAGAIEAAREKFMNGLPDSKLTGVPNLVFIRAYPLAG